jgi:hypothetical protein
MMDNLSAQLPEPGVKDSGTPTPLPSPSLLDMAALNSSKPSSHLGSPSPAPAQAAAAEEAAEESARPPKSPRLGASRYATDPFVHSQFGTEGAQKQAAASMGDGMGQASGYLSSGTAQCWPSLAGMGTGNGTSGNSTSTMADDAGGQSVNNPLQQSSKTYGSTNSLRQRQPGSPVVKAPLPLQQLVTTGMPTTASPSPVSDQPHTPSMLAASSAPATHGTPGVIRHSARARKPNVRRLDLDPAALEPQPLAPVTQLMDSTASTALASPTGAGLLAYDPPHSTAMQMSAAGGNTATTAHGLAGQARGCDPALQVSGNMIPTSYNAMHVLSQSPAPNGKGGAALLVSSMPSRSCG